MHVVLVRLSEDTYVIRDVNQIEDDGVGTNAEPVACVCEGVSGGVLVADERCEWFDPTQRRRHGGVRGHHLASIYM